MTRRTTPATVGLIVAVCVAYAMELAAGGERVCADYGLVPARWSVVTAITSLFLHDPRNLWHVGGNLAFLAAFGILVEPQVGSLLTLAVYFAAGLGGALLHCLVNPGAEGPLVGCSGALFGLMALAGVIRPRLLGFVAAYVGVNVWHAFAGGEGSVSFGAHLGGFIVGAVVAMAMRLTGSEALEAA